MTDMNREEIKDRREEIITELGSELTKSHSELSQLKDALEEYSETLDDIKDGYSNLPENQRRGFVSSLETITEKAVEAESPEEVLNTKEELERTFENPLLDSVQTQYISFYTKLGIVIEEDVKSGLERQIRSAAKRDPEETLEQIQKLLSEVEDLPEPVYETLQSSVEDELPNAPPPEELLNVVGELNSRYRSLETLSRTLSESAWAPSQLDQIYTWQELVNPGAKIDCIDQVNRIDELTESVPDIVPVKFVIKSDLEEREDDLRSHPFDVFNEIELLLEKINEYQDILTEVSDLSEVMDFESEAEEFTEIVLEWENEPPNNLSSLVKSVQRVSEEVNNWRDELDSEWREKGRIVSNYDEIIQIEPPEEILEYVGGELPIDSELAHSYNVVVKADTWISEHEDNVLEYLSPEAKELFHSLSENKKYDISKGELDALDELIDIVDVKVSIDE
jgi:uncharacterized phage infection (PIP) family protein YhgE